MPIKNLWRFGEDRALGAGGAPAEGASVELPAEYLAATRRPAIYFNVSFGVLLLAIVPIRHLGFGLPFFPSSLSLVLEWGLIVPCVLALAYIRWAWPPVRRVERVTAVLIAISVSALLWDVLLWQRAHVLIPHEYSGLFFIAVLSVAGLTWRSATVVSALFLGLCALSVLRLEPRTAETGFHLYFDIVAVGFALLNAYSLRREIRSSWETRRHLDELAFRDPLTGLANRRWLEERAARVFEQARREGRPVALALIDLDRFKGLNDRQGHAAGDLALKAVANVLAGAARRPLDVAARIGGDEFLMLWYDVAIAGCTDLCGRICDAVSAADITHAASATGQLTLSVGAVSGIPPAPGSYERFRRAADAELYKVKHGAGGRVRVIPADTP